MRRNSYVSLVLVAILAAAIIGCGSSSSTSGQPKPTGLTKRVLVSNEQSNTVNLLDAQKDVVSTKTFGVTSPGKMVTAGGQTVVLDNSSFSMTILDNAKEVVTAAALLDAQPFDVAITHDGTLAFAAERNVGEVRFATTVDGAVNALILNIPNARRLVMSPNGTKLLAFSDTPQAPLPNIQSIFVIDVASKSVTTISSANFDQPITGVFNNSETQAFILNCGAQCGGTAASVVSVDFSATPATFGPVISVPAAATGFLDGNSLFVAGTPATPPTGPSAACPLSRCGLLTVVTTTTGAAATPVPITDGLHQKMAMANGRLYIGAAGCTVDPGSAPNIVRGCLSIFNTATPGTKFPEESAFRKNFDVTGLQPISNRSVVYVVQGGELDIFDATTDAPSTSIRQIDFVGTAIDAVQIDP